MEWNEELIHSLIKEQFSILSNLKDPQISITHIKPHGALNSMACKDPAVSSGHCVLCKTTLSRTHYISPSPQ